jgi:hydrogenase nickel incorporation protein HypA/HybF
MHEVGIMTEAVRLAIETARTRQAGRVHRLRLRVGAMSGAAPDALSFAFDVVCRGTIAEGAVLDIEAVPAACWCATCAAEFESGDFLGECPRCGALSSELRRGRELELAAVEVS